MIKVRKEPDHGPLYEHCCFCDKETMCWTVLPKRKPGDQVACCRPCAKVHEPREVPTKDAWFEAEKALHPRALGAPELLKPKLAKTCPECGEDSFGMVLAKLRMKQQVCRGCDWKGEPFVPERKPIRTVKSVPVEGYWYYEMFDQYGSIATCSEGFDSQAEATREAKKDIERTSKAHGYGKCTAVIWPPTTKVTGTKVTL